MPQFNLLPPLDAWPRQIDGHALSFCCGLNACFCTQRRSSGPQLENPAAATAERDRRDQGTMASPLTREGHRTGDEGPVWGAGASSIGSMCVCVCVIFVTPRRPRYISIYGCSPLNLCMCVSAAASLLFQASPSPSPLHVPLHPLIIHPLLHAAGPISSPQPPRD